MPLMFVSLGSSASGMGEKNITVSNHFEKNSRHGGHGSGNFFDLQIEEQNVAPEVNPYKGGMLKSKSNTSMNNIKKLVLQQTFGLEKGFKPWENGSENSDLSVSTQFGVV